MSKLIRKLDVRITGIHFHLRSNVRIPDMYRQAIDETVAACRNNEIEPEYLDCGGGLPVEGEEPLWEKTDGTPFDLVAYAKVLTEVSQKCPSIREIWLENGRFISSASAALIVRILDIKDRNRSRYLICDGGRTNQAIVSEWQRNPITTVPARTGPTRLTTICGPTCMAYDQLARLELPTSLRAGDLLLWRNAGAYHIPWETRFSFGLAAVVVIDVDNTLRLARSAETFADWWKMWRKGSEL